LEWMSGHHYAVEGRSFIEVTHLALLGVKIAGPAFWVYFYKSIGIRLHKMCREYTEEECRETKEDNIAIQKICKLQKIWTG